MQIQDKKKPCEEKKNFAPKIALKNVFKNVVINYKSVILKFKIPTKSFKQKRCGIVRLTVPNFLYIYEKPLFE